MPTKRAAHGIPTRYREGNFRSRLEARWAAFFDRVGWTWIYEPLDLDGWIPDFLVQGAAPFLVEVGPCILPSDYQVKAEKPLLSKRLTLVLGVGPLPRDGDEAGLSTLPTTEFAHWAWCDECFRLCLWRLDDFTALPCGHGTPTTDAHLSPIKERWLLDEWAAAGSTVQWRRIA